MKVSEFDYNLPKELIAQTPAKPRDHSRLLIMGRKSGEMTDKYFYDIVNYFKKGDVLVLNNTKVFPARLKGKKKETGGKIEVFLLRKLCAMGNIPPAPFKGGILKGEAWQCLVGNHRRRENLEVEFGHSLQAKILRHNNDGTWDVEFNKKGSALMRIINKIGQTPLPPYIKRTSRIAHRVSLDDKNYQTVYADEKKIGSVAAPTAGLHFTPALLKKIKAKGVEVVYITLHVGLGTFAPVKVNDITKHKMHAEWVEAQASALKKIWQAKEDGRRVGAVGTTSVRALESVFAKMTNDKFQMTNQCQNPNFKNSKIQNYLKIQNSKIKNYSGWVNIFIYPGFEFKVIDAMITNFHLPKSTLLMLVSAFAGHNKILMAYRHAIKKKYRFYSYGDAMLIS